MKFVYGSKTEIPAGLESHYKEINGKWYLQCKGAKPQDEFETVQNSLIASRADTQKYKDIVGKFGQHTPETLATLEEEIAGLKAGKGDIEAQVAAMVEVRTANLSRDLAAAKQKADKAEGDLGTMKGEFNKSTIEMAVMNGASGKVRDSALIDAKLHAGLDLELNEAGLAVTKESCALGAGLTVDQWLGKKLETMTHWEPESQSGLSKGRKGKTSTIDNPWAKDTINVTQQHQILAADPAKAAALQSAASQ